MDIFYGILIAIYVVGFGYLAITAPPYSPAKRFLARMKKQTPVPAPVRRGPPPEPRQPGSPLKDAFWLTICCVNLYFFVQYLFETTGVTQAFWGLMVGAWIRLTYTSIRNATKERA